MNISGYKLTNPQQSILLTEQFNENTCVSNVCGTLSILEKINVQALEQAINLFIKNNDSVRIELFGSGSDIQQFIRDYSFVTIEKVSITNEYSLENLESDVINKHFSLLNSNLFRFVIFSNPDGTGGFIANLHHIISDAWTMGLLIDQIMEYYSHIINNEEISSDPNSSYIDYIFDEQKYIDSPKFKRSQDFWESQFENLEFSYLKDVQSHSYNAIRKSVVLSKDETNLLLDFCKENKTSLFSLFMATLNIYLSKINNTNSSVVGTPVLNRSNFKEKNTTGMYIATVPFRVDFDINSTCIELINKISKHEMSVFRNQKYPYNLLLDNIRKKFNISKNLYDVALSYQNARNHRTSSNIPYSCKWLFNNCVVNNLDIHLYDIDDTGMISIYYDFKKEIFTLEDINLLHDRLMYIIKQIVSTPNLTLGQVEITTPKEKKYILENYNNFNLNDKFISVYDLFKNQVHNNGNKIAICDKNIKLTYLELNNLANLIALKLKEHNISSGDIVCLALSNSIEFVASVLATQKLDACYIPIDVNYPNDRIEYIIQNSNSKLLITHSDTLSSVNVSCDKLLRITLADFKYNSPVQDINYKLKKDDLAYIIYTSGSTGKPKGVKITHGSLSNYITWAIKQYVHGEETNFPLFSSVAFDLTVTSIYTPICSGNTIYIYKNDNIQILLKEIVEDKKVHIVKLTPGHFNLLQDINLEKSIINKFILGGDTLTKEICDKITSLFNHPIHIYNEYGPTESTVGCMIYEYNSNGTSYASVPIGYPIDNTQILILNKNLELLPLGCIGEMYISGNGLSIGYTDEKKTRESFIENPFSTGKLYKTGDLAILHPNGVMEYLGRSNFQVKLNGYRIELGEIQSILLAHPLIKDTFVTLIEVDNHKFLCAYYTSSSKIDNLYKYLNQYLPNYMIPNYFIKVDEIPLNINGKIDKSSLPLPTKNKSKYCEPQNEIEELLQSSFEELLKLNDKISVKDNIFDYYVDSLSLIRLQALLYTKGLFLNTQDFYNYPSIRTLANFILENKHTQKDTLTMQFPNICEVKHPLNVNFSYKNILLFGATGFLGIHILYYLLKYTEDKIFCVIREKNKATPLQRLAQKFDFYFPSMDINKYLYRIKVIEGNILNKNFSLQDNLYEYLGTKCDCVIDTAALVKHYGNYELFNNTNVNSTKRMIDFCEKYNVPLHYVSTMSVSGYGLVNTPIVDFDENSLYVGQSYMDNVYVRSKFEAENAIINACKSSNLIASIYRVGTITNRYSDGFFQENFDDNAFLNRLNSFVELQSFPENFSGFTSELTPVDYCAKFIVRLLKNQHNNLNIYHLYNDNYISCDNIVSILNKFGANIKVVSLDTFKTEVAKSNTNHFGITAYIQNITNSNNIKFHNDFTISALKNFNLYWPNIDESYIQKIYLSLKNNQEKGGTNDEKLKNF